MGTSKFCEFCKFCAVYHFSLDYPVSHVSDIFPRRVTKLCRRTNRSENKIQAIVFNPAGISFLYPARSIFVMRTINRGIIRERTANLTTFRRSISDICEIHHAGLFEFLLQPCEILSTFFSNDAPLR